jgi:hypothetical protein
LRGTDLNFPPLSLKRVYYLIEKLIPTKLGQLPAPSGITHIATRHAVAIGPHYLPEEVFFEGEKKKK